MIGKTIGHYRVTEQLGRGGMGEVYLAEDLSLGRKVALKFLPDVFTGDPERMARFEREAKLLASLNHPNIAAIYGLEQAEGKRFLVLEYVEGETLQQKLSKGPLPIEDALGVCRQIAEGLEAAHESGVIHRDLKPANVMITAGDKVKILDFGLAKALADEIQSIDSSHSPTITEGMTQPGVVLGTAAYMSPEQAKGKTVDKRADIWAFGCILYECLTGKKAFGGETVTETLAAILRAEPDWNVLPATTPQHIRFVLRRCLEKDVSRRFRDAADVQIQIEEVTDISKAATPVKQRRPWLAWSIAAVFILAFTALSFVHFSQRTAAPTEQMRFQIALPDKVSLAPNGTFALSPDGRRLAFVAVGSNGTQCLWLRALDSLEARPLIGTESIGYFFWSPDSRFIAFVAGGNLKKIEISGGVAQTICDSPGNVIGGSWNRNNVIIFGTRKGGLMRVSARGGTASAVTKPNPARQELYHAFPTFLPDGQHFIYYCETSLRANDGVYVSSLDAKPEEHGPKQLVATDSFPIYVLSHDYGPGQLLFMREQILMAQPFDDSRLELIGEPLALAERVGLSTIYSFFAASYGFFSASTNGILVYRSGGIQLSQLTWFDRSGKVLGTVGEPGLYMGLAISPDGARAAVGWQNSAQTPQAMWLHDFSRGTNTQFTFGGTSDQPVWSPDGSRIIFAENRSGVFDLYHKLASGVKEEELLLKSNEIKFPTSWSSDGRYILYTANDPKTKGDLWVLPLEGDRKAIEFLRTKFNEADGHFSPDMRWVAYVSDESGSREIYVRAFSHTTGGTVSESGGQWRVSKGSGIGPRWGRDGKELYYRAPDGKVMVVEIIAGKVFQAETPKPLFQAPPDLSEQPILYFSSWDVTADGNRFLLPAPVAERSPSPFNVILNWTALLKK